MRDVRSLESEAVAGQRGIGITAELKQPRHRGIERSPDCSECGRRHNGACKGRDGGPGPLRQGEGPMTPGRPALSDDELLALVFQLRDDACAEVMRERLAAQTKSDVSLDYVEERVQRLNLAGLIHRIYLRPRQQRDFCVRLTALGVERIQDLQRKPISARTE